MLLVTAIIIAPIILSAFSVVSESVKLSTAVQASHIAGIINIIQLMPANTIFEYKLPPIDCKIDVSNTDVRFTTGDESYSESIIQTPVNITRSGVECKDEIVYFARCIDGVKIRLSRGCI